MLMCIQLQCRRKLCREVGSYVKINSLSDFRCYTLILLINITVPLNYTYVEAEKCMIDTYSLENYDFHFRKIV